MGDGEKFDTNWPIRSWV